MKKTAFILFLYIGALSMVLMSLHYFQSDTAGILKLKEIIHSNWFLLFFRIHVFMGLLAICIGPFQFMENLRNNYTNSHRIIGYIYVTSVFLGSITGIVIAQFAMGGWITRIGFSLLSITWLYTAMKAIYTIRKGDILSHKRWMFLNYGLTFASITQRTLLLVPLLLATPFLPTYQLSAWLPWLLNLKIAYFLYQRTHGVK